jgi:uncharacterized protein YdeI (YjbR/CyaY-like superfamily)
MTLSTLPELPFSSRADWRAWLETHHGREPGLWLVYHHATSGVPSVTYAEAVEEALCFGWIDSRTGRLDGHRHRQLFSPRRPGSPWSRINKERVDRLSAQALMAPAGLAVVTATRASGAWNLYDEVEALVIPPDLQAALEAEPPALANFTAFSASARKQVLWWIKSARRPGTRAGRIADAARLAAENRRPDDPRR